MSLLEEYTTSNAFIDWRLMFNQFQEYRKKAIEQSNSLFFRLLVNGHHLTN